MEQELNIAAILKDKPKGTKLWTPIYGDCEFLGITSKTRPIQITSKNGTHYFREDGKYDENGEVCLFPSNDMQDWSKFAWKKGDVLFCKSYTPYTYTIFDHFTNDDYTEFYGKFNYLHEYRKDYGNTSGKTASYEKLSESEAKYSIEVLESFSGGKLNLKTLEIEKPESQFKDGDIVVVKNNITYAKIILILRNSYDDCLKSYAFVNCSTHESYFDDNSIPRDNRKLRFATDSEKQQLFDALAKEGKRWNAETKTLEDLPKKCEFKAFDWCLMRRGNIDAWHLCQYSDACDDGYYAIGGNFFKECAPYNEKTEHLLGTTDDWEGGEG